MGKSLTCPFWYDSTDGQRHGPVLLSKNYLSGGFYQILPTPSGALELAFPFPNLLS